MIRKLAPPLAGVGLLVTLILAAHADQQAQPARAAVAEPRPARAERKPTASKLAEVQKIMLAMSAGPAAISKNATIVDMTDMSKTQMKQLRGGTNGWVCYASVEEPMCLDKAWQKWLDAWMSRGELKISGTGIGYMLRGDNGASNTDPFATGPTADNQWVVSPPHIMVLFEDPVMLDAYPTDPKNGGPWVMWKGTPYAHLMVPVSPVKAATLSVK